MSKMKEKNRYRVRIINLDEGRSIRDQMDFETLREALSCYDYLTETEVNCWVELDFHDAMDPHNRIGIRKEVDHWRAIDLVQCRCE